MSVTASAFKPLRWSTVRDCPRKAVYEGIDAPARERSLRENRQLYRGRSVGHDWVVSVATEKNWKVWVDSGPSYWLPPDLAATNKQYADVIAEQRVFWELGVGHCDLYIKETGTVVEVLSSQNPAGDQIHSKLVQAAGYARALQADNLALIIVDPATLEEERVIVASGTPQWGDLFAECDERVAQVVAWRDHGVMPERVCTKPGDAWGHFCLFAEHCFEGWEPSAVESVDLEEAQTLAIRLGQVKAQRLVLSAQDRALETEQKNVQAELEPLIPAGEWQVGGWRVKRSDRTRRSFKLTLAEKDSRIPDALLDEFTSVSGYTVWDVEQTGPAVVHTDDGAPF